MRTFGDNAWPCPDLGIGTSIMASFVILKVPTTALDDLITSWREGGLKKILANVP